MTTPENKRALRSFIGMIYYYRNMWKKRSESMHRTLRTDIIARNQLMLSKVYTTCIQNKVFCSKEFVAYYITKVFACSEMYVNINMHTVIPKVFCLRISSLIFNIKF